jgi:cytochrome P450
MATSSVTIQHITSNPTIYVKPRFTRIALERVLGKGILTAEGERHKRQRKVLNPAFATGCIRDIVPIFSTKATDLVNMLLDDVKSQSIEGINVLPILNRVTLDIISSSGVFFFVTISDIGFGYDFNTLHNPDDPFATAYTKISHVTPVTRALNIAATYIPFLWSLPFPRVVEIAEARKSISTRATRLVQEKLAQTIAGKDILSVMIEENRKSQETLSETDIVDQIMTFLLAGHETTSTAVNTSNHLIMNA